MCEPLFSGRVLVNLVSTLEYLGRDAVWQAKAYTDSLHDDAEATDFNKRESTQHIMDDCCLQCGNHEGILQPSLA